MDKPPAVEITTLPHDALLELCTQALQNWERLEKESLRFYHADGSFSVLASAEAVTTRRMECAAKVKELDDAYKVLPHFPRKLFDTTLAERFKEALSHAKDEVRDALADDIREAGWAVAVHNDYRQNGRDHTFWLFTRGDRNVKGEGFTDAEALNQIRHELNLNTGK